MAILEADTRHYYSIKTGTAGSQAAGTAAGSLGKYISQTEVPDNTVHNVFDAIAGSESAAGDTEYRCLFVRNHHATLTWTDVRLYVVSDQAGGAAIAVAVDGTTKSQFNASSAQADEVADEGTPPSGEVFSAPTSYATGLAMGDLAPGEVKAYWIRRTVTAGTGPVDDDQATWKVEGQTTA